MRAFAITPSEFANVRNCPGLSGKIVDRVDNGQIVTVSTEVVDGWTRLVEPAGWVFEGVTFKRVPDIQPGDVVSDGFDSPVGTVKERATAKIWPGDWFDANPYGTQNATSIHTGSDLNKNRPTWDSDNGAPLYACASGIVTAAQTYRVWHWIVVIKHDPLPDGTVVWSRSAHMRTVDVVTGQRVERGELIGTVGDADGFYSAHLHFDIARTDILETKPHHWPGMNRAEVERHYINPKPFIEAHHWTRYAGG